MTITYTDLSVPAHEARQAWLEYRDAVRAGSDDPGDAILAKAYRAIVRGKRIIDVHETMRLAGLNDDGSPKLAIVQADAVFCWARWNGYGSDRHMSFAPSAKSLTATRSASRIDMPVGCPSPPRRTWNGREWVATASGHWSGRAVVPTIPPRYRPKFKLQNYRILWEAEWKRVPVDPILLKPLDGGLHIVLAQWDLTPLEAAVLGRKLDEGAAR